MITPGYIVWLDHSDGDRDEFLMDLVVAEVDGAPSPLCEADMSSDCRSLGGKERSGLQDHEAGTFFCWSCIDNLVRSHVVELRPANAFDRERLSRVAL